MERAGVRSRRAWRAPGARASLLVGLAALLGAAPPARGEEVPRAPERVVVGVPEHFPPSFERGEERQPTGFAVDVWNALAERLGLETEWVVFPHYREVVEAVASGRVDVVPELGITRDREARMRFTRPIQVQPVMIFVRAATTGIEGLDDLEGRKVGVVPENVGEKLLLDRPEVERSPCDHPRLCFIDLVAGEVDAVIYPAPPAWQILHDLDLADHVKVVGQPLLEVKRAIAVRPEREDLRLRLDAAVAAFLVTPEYQRIHGRWFGSVPIYWTVERVLLWAAAVLLLVALLMGLWRYRAIVRLNRRLVVAHEQRARAERSLRQREAEFHHAQKLEAVGRLAGGVAHDFNNLLMAIGGYAEILLARLAADDPRRREVSEILTAAERARGLTGKLLAFSRKQAFLPTTFDLGPAVLDMERMLRPLLGEDVDLRLTVPADPAPVTADRAQLEQVVMNLAVNSRDAMPEGGALEIRVRALDVPPEGLARHPRIRPGRWAVLEVEDAGSGMEPAVLERIFEPFFTTKGPGKGTGLGLSTVHGIVEQSGGDIEVSSRPGHGTTFRVFLPVQEQVPAEEAAVAPRSPAAGGSETVLVVEDEPQVRDLIVRALRQRGYAVVTARDGREALAVAASGDGKAATLLVTDLVMPKMGGHELAAVLRAHRPDLRVLIVSGYSDRLPRPEDIVPGRTAFLQKPFSAEELGGAVRALLDAMPQAGATSP